jgi:hypothetical protein
LWIVAGLGSLGFWLLPYRPVLKIVISVIYVPITFFFLAHLGLIAGCVIHGPRACP